MKRISAMLLALAMTAALCACGQTAALEEAPPPAASEPMPEETAAPVTLSVAASYDSADGRESYERLVSAYEAASGNSVVSGGEPDVMRLTVADADTQALIASGGVVSLEDIRAQYPQYAANIREDMLPAAPDGRHYAVPARAEWEMLFVNRAVLRNCGADEPQDDYTWEQFAAVCRTVHDNGYTPIACALGKQPEVMLDYVLLDVMGTADDLALPTVEENRRVVEDGVYDAWLTAIDELNKLYKLGWLSRNALTAEYETAADMFAVGDAAFFVGDCAALGYLADNWGDSPEDYAVACVPARGARAASDAVGSVTAGWYISSRAWNDDARRAAAVGLVEWLSSDEALGAFPNDGVTVFAPAVQPQGGNALVRSALAAGARLSSLTGSAWNSVTDDMRDELAGVIPDAFTGKKTAKQALNEALVSGST